jgi:4-amino-4-deoxy-L-arabinose transferase-like glycosyltransferase
LDRSTLRTALAIALGVAAVRALLFAGLDLYTDEAYYWLWSRRPALWYFDHPPMVAWMLAALGDLRAEWALRLPFVLTGATTVLSAAAIATRLSASPRAPVLAALLAASAPMLHLTGALALPDAPFQAAYAAGVFFLVSAGRGPRWALAGVLVGLALVSKYSAALLAPALLLLVLWDAELRAALRSPWPWLGGAIAVAIFLPTLVADSRREFASIGFQMHHGFRSGASLKSFASFLGAQLGGAGPVTLVAGLAALARPRTSAAKRVAAAALLPIAVTFVSALRSDGEANWTAHVFPLLAAAAGAWLADRAAAGRIVGAQVALCGAFLVAFFAVQHGPWATRASAYQRFHGWETFAQDLRAKAAGLCAATRPACDPADPFVVPTTYRLTPVSFYAGWRRLGGGFGRISQLDAWDERPRAGEPILVLATQPWELDVFAQRHPELRAAGTPARIEGRAGDGTRVREAFLGAYVSR